MGRFGEQGGRSGFGGGRPRDRDNFSGGFNRGGRPERRLEMHSATCSKCGKECRVPFKPTGNKPVFCSDCFSQQNAGSNHFNPRSEGQSNSNFGPQLDQINAKLDKIIMILKELELDVEEPDLEESEEDSEDEI